ncbi:MAG TPA: DUF167 family protein [Gemmatimonadales bacterium]|nr:DUF167 family protein [Gemmatimonadales bacterium]
MIRLTDDGVRIQVWVQPGSACTEIVGEHGDALKIRVAAPPAGGAANEALVALLAKRLGVARAAVEVARGGSGRSKTVLVRGLRPETAASRLGLLNFRAGGP